MGAYITIVYPNNYVIKFQTQLTKTVRSPDIITQLSNLDLIWGGATNLYDANLNIINECKQGKYYLGSQSTIKQIEAYLQRESLLQNRIQVSKQFDEKEEKQFKSHKKSCPKLEKKTSQVRNERTFSTQPKKILKLPYQKKYRIRRNSYLTNNQSRKDFTIENLQPNPQPIPFPFNKPAQLNHFQIKYFLDGTLLSEQTQKEGEPAKNNILQIYEVYQNKEMTIKYQTHKPVLKNINLFCRNKRKGSGKKDQDSIDFQTINLQSNSSINRPQRRRSSILLKKKK